MVYRQYRQFGGSSRIKGYQSSHYNGRTYHSKAEARFAQELDLRVKGKDILSWEPQYKVSIDVIGEDGRSYHITNYFVDFIVYYPDGDVELVEVKGFETEVWRLKRKLLEAVFLPKHPEMRYSVVKV